MTASPPLGDVQLLEPQSAVLEIRNVSDDAQLS